MYTDYTDASGATRSGYLQYVDNHKKLGLLAHIKHGGYSVKVPLTSVRRIGTCHFCCKKLITEEA